MVPSSIYQPWWIPKPLTKEQMEMEIHSSLIRPATQEEFSESDIHETLRYLKLVKELNDASTARQ